MNRILRVTAVFFMSISLSLGVQAGRKKDFIPRPSNEQTLKQQKNLAKLGGKKKTANFSSSQSFLTFTKPEHYAIAALLGLSVYIAYTQTGSAQPSQDSIKALDKNLSYPLVIQSTEQPIEFPCPGQPLSVVNQEVLNGFIHPGLFNGHAKKLSTAEEEQYFIKECRKRNLFRADANGEEKCFPDQQLTKVWEFDQSYKESEYFDRAFSEKAWDYLERNFFSQKSAFNSFFGTSSSSFQQHIKILNGIFQRGTGEIRPEEFRYGHHTFINRNNFPGTNVEQWEAYISKNKPHLLDSYNDIVAIANNLPQYFKKHPQLAAFPIQNYVKLPFTDRFKLALDGIASTNNVDLFPVLTENMSFIQAYSAEEFDTLFKKLRSTTIKKFKNDPVEAAAYFHFHYVKIHPHADANGRTARAVMNLILMSAGFDPVIFPSNNQYTNACLNSDSKPFELFLRAIISTQQQNKDFFNNLTEELSTCSDNCQELLDNYLI